MREIFEVDLDGPQPFEVPALLISAMAWPGADDADVVRRHRLYLSLCAWFVRDQAARDPDWASQVQWIRPDYAWRDPTEIAKDIRTLERRLRDRVIAGHMAIAFLKEAETGEVPPLPKGVLRLSLNELAKRAADELGFEGAENLETRVWRASRPIIHLCAAWCTLAQERFNVGGKQVDFGEAMRSSAFLAEIIRRAELYEPLLERSRLEITPDELISFRLAPAGVN
jgi:hypothetical protein